MNMSDKLNPYPGNLRHIKVDETDEMRRKKLDEAIESFNRRALTGHSLSSKDDNGVFLFLNDQFPIIATASRADISENADDDKRYPIVHAVLSVRDTSDGKREYFVRFESIISIPEGEGLEYKCPHVDAVRMELIKFVHDSFKNRWSYEIDGESYTVADMSGTMLNRKYVLLPDLKK